MKQTSYKLLTKTWEDPDGVVHEGEWREFFPYTITYTERDKCTKQGFTHLLDGNWLWVRYPDKGNKLYFIHIETIDKVTTMDDNDVVMSWSNNNFNFKESK